MSKCPKRCDLCVPGSQRVCYLSYCRYWGVQTCTADGRSFGLCLEQAPPPECQAVANAEHGSAALEQCCIDNGYCCVDTYDLESQRQLAGAFGFLRRGDVQPVRRAMLLLATAGALFVSMAAQAAPCGKPDLLDALPPDGADGVPTDATPSAIYAHTADYLGEDVPLEDSDRHTGSGEGQLRLRRGYPHAHAGCAAGGRKGVHGALAPAPRHRDRQQGARS